MFLTCFTFYSLLLCTGCDEDIFAAVPKGGDILKNGPLTKLEAKLKKRREKEMEAAKAEDQSGFVRKLCAFCALPNAKQKCSGCYMKLGASCHVLRATVPAAALEHP